MRVGHLSKHTIECWISVIIHATQKESNLSSFWMNNLMSDCLYFIISIFNESHCLLLLSTVRIINVSPNSFNIIWINNILNNIYCTILLITCCEMIESLSLPNCQCSISHSNIIILYISCQSWYKIPWLILSLNKSCRICSQKSCPKSIPILN
jgi:hypothetical protein